MRALASLDDTWEYSVSANPTPLAVIPAHVSADSVLPFAFGFGQSTDLEPYSALVSAVHKGPRIFYALDAFPGPKPAWVIRKAADLRRVYLDTEHFSNWGFAGFGELINESWGLVPAETDPPLHQLHRAFVNPIFTPKALARLDGKIHEIAREYIAKFKDNGECDFMKDFAFEFPIKVFMELMGLPLDKTDLFLKWERGLLHSKTIEDVISATRSVVDYLRFEIEDRKKNPNDDLLSYGVQGRIGERPLTEDELVGFAFNLFIGGLDTVSAHMGLQFRHLAEHPDHQRIVRDNPDKIPNAVEELMRAYAGSNTFRICVKETELCGQKIMPGDKVAMMVIFAGRDPDEYEQPDVIDFDRNAKHLSFAFGPHLCVGIHLARRELRTGMEEFLRAIPEFTIKPGAKITTLLSGVLQPTSLPLVWQA